MWCATAGACSSAPPTGRCNPSSTSGTGSQPALRHALRAALAVGTGYVIATLLPLGLARLLGDADHRGGAARAAWRRRWSGATSAWPARWWAACWPPACWRCTRHAGAGADPHRRAGRGARPSRCGATWSRRWPPRYWGWCGRTCCTPAAAPPSRCSNAWATPCWVPASPGRFSYVLPSWERGQLSPAGAAHAGRRWGCTRGCRWSWRPSSGSTPSPTWPGGWRGAKPTTRSPPWCRPRSARWSRPRAVQPPLALLEHLQGHSYQLMGQLERRPVDAGAATRPAAAGGHSPGRWRPRPQPSKPRWRRAWPRQHLRRHRPELPRRRTATSSPPCPRCCPTLSSRTSALAAARLHLSQDLAGQVQADAGSAAGQPGRGTRPGRILICPAARRGGPGRKSGAPQASTCPNLPNVQQPRSRAQKIQQPQAARASLEATRP